MLMTRRGFLGGMAGILAAAAAPAIITTPGLLMPVKTLWTPPTNLMIPSRLDMLIGWKITNDGNSTVTIQGITYDQFYKMPTDVVLQPQEGIRFDPNTRAMTRFNVR